MHAHSAQNVSRATKVTPYSDTPQQWWKIWTEEHVFQTTTVRLLEEEESRPELVLQREQPPDQDQWFPIFPKLLLTLQQSLESQWMYIPRCWHCSLPSSRKIVETDPAHPVHLQGHTFQHGLNLVLAFQNRSFRHHHRQNAPSLIHHHQYRSILEAAHQTQKRY